MGYHRADALSHLWFSNSELQKPLPLRFLRSVFQ